MYEGSMFNVQCPTVVYFAIGRLPEISDDDILSKQPLVMDNWEG